MIGDEKISKPILSRGLSVIDDFVSDNVEFQIGIIEDYFNDVTLPERFKNSIKLLGDLLKSLKNSINIVGRIDYEYIDDEIRLQIQEIRFKDFELRNKLSGFFIKMRNLSNILKGLIDKRRFDLVPSQFQKLLNIVENVEFLNTLEECKLLSLEYFEIYGTLKDNSKKKSGIKDVIISLYIFIKEISLCIWSGAGVAEIISRIESNSSSVYDNITAVFNKEGEKLLKLSEVFKNKGELWEQLYRNVGQIIAEIDGLKVFFEQEELFQLFYDGIKDILNVIITECNESLDILYGYTNISNSEYEMIFTEDIPKQ